jgi:hypothetical protein
MARTQNQTKQRHLVPFVHLYPHVEKGAERDLRFLSVCLIWGWSDENVGRDGTIPIFEGGTVPVQFLFGWSDRTVPPSLPFR